MRRLLERRPLLAVFGAVTLIDLALLPPGIKTIDEHSMYAVSDSLVTGNGFRVPCELGGIPGVDGCYSAWYPLLSILAVPFVALAHGLASLFDLPVKGIGFALVPAVSAISTGAAAAATAGIARRLGAGWGPAVLAAVAFAFGTEALTHSRTFFAESLCAALVGWAVLALVGDEKPSQRRRWLGWGLLALAVLAKPPMVVVGPALGVALALAGRRPSRAVGPIVASLAGLALYMGYNLLRFRDALEFGGEGRRADGSAYLSLDAIEALGLLTISPGRGLLWFSPVAVLGAVLLARRGRDRLALACGMVALAILAVYLGNPGVDANWGTRYLVAALPLLCAGVALAVRWERRLAVALVAVGLVIQIPTTLAFYTRYYSEVRDTGAPLSGVYWSVTDTPLVQSWPAMFRQLDDASKASDIDALVSGSGEPLDPERAERTEEQELLKVVALWWWLLPAADIPRWLGLLVELALIASGVALLRWVAQRGRAEAEPVAGRRR